MKIVDVTARSSKELETIKRKIAAWLKANKNSCNIGETQWNVTNGLYRVQVENDGTIGDYISGIIVMSPTTKNVQIEEYEAEYMWNIDKYIRPVTVVSFTSKSGLVHSCLLR